LVKEIIIMRDSGIPLFHYSVSGEKKLDELVAGFLSAMGSMAEQVGEQQIKVMEFATNKFVWEKNGDLFFIALVSLDDSAEIYRAILHDLSEQFVSKYYAKLRHDIIIRREFLPFIDSVESTLQKFDGIPGLARRYKTALIPQSDFRALKESLADIEANPSILRGSLITHDGYIIVSNLRAYEIEAVLDQLDNLRTNLEKTDSLLVVHTSLDPVTSFFILPLTSKGQALFVVKAGKNNDDYLNMVKPFIDTVLKINLEDIKKINPSKREEYTGFFEHDVVKPIEKISQVMDEARIKFSDVSDNFQTSAMKVLKAINGKRTIGEIQDRSKLPKATLTEVIAYLITHGVVRVVKLFPIMKERDERFLAYLEVVGMPKKEYDIVDSVWIFCDGSYSIKEISEQAQIPTTRLIEILRSLGNYVTWNYERGHKKNR